jgi:hypothetical protein
VTVQNVFYLEIHQNKFFFTFKKLFLTSTHQNNIKIYKKNYLKKFKNFKNGSQNTAFDSRHGKPHGLDWFLLLLSQIIFS